mgnify:CR=1 FL=1
MTTEIYNYIILSIVVLAYLHLWFYTFKYQKIEKKIENRINERFEDFITQKVASMENLVNNYTNQLKDITKARIKKIEITHEKFEESSTKILNNINNLENEYSEFIDILKEAVNVAKILSEEIEVKNNLIIQKNDHIKKLEAMIEQRNKKIKRLEDAKNNW